MNFQFNKYPKILYKYRNWDNDYNKNLLLKQECYFSSVEQFNDPYDCQLPFIWDKEDLSEDKIFLKMIETGRKAFPDISESELHVRAYEQQKEGWYKNPDHLKEINNIQINKIKKEVGVLCLSSVEDNFLMWSHYSNSHTGYCIGFNPEQLYNGVDQGTLSKIEYTKEIPKCKIFQTDDEFIHRAYFVKSKDWEYEQEYRITKVRSARKIFNFPPRAVKEVIFGCKMTIENKLNLIEFIKLNYPRASVFEMKLSDSNFKLEKHQIR